MERFLVFFTGANSSNPVNHIIGWVWSDLSVLLARRSMLHLGRRRYGDEGFPANALEAFPRGTHMGPDTGIYSSVPQSLFSSPLPPWRLLFSHLVCSVC